MHQQFKDVAQHSGQFWRSKSLFSVSSLINWNCNIKLCIYILKPIEILPNLCSIVMIEDNICRLLAMRTSLYLEAHKFESQ